MKTNIPKVGFVSLGCPKAGSDAERILTQLRAEGYEISNSYEQSDLVVVNTCGFIDSAVEESLEAIGEAMDKNGKVIVTGCLGAKKDEREESLYTKQIEVLTNKITQLETKIELLIEENIQLRVKVVKMEARLINSAKKKVNRKNEKG